MEISDNNTQRLFNEWEERWSLANPKPEMPKSDLILNVLKIMVALGAILLSGSRTGNAVAEIGAFADFGEKIGYIGLGRGVFTAVEGLLAFMAFDAALLLAGYLNSSEKKEKEWDWFGILFWVAFAAAFLANILPATELFPEAAKLWGARFVDIVVGMATPVMAFVAGKVIGADRKRIVEKISVIESEWEERKRRAWYASPEYKTLKGIPKKQKKTNGNGEDIKQTILNELQSGSKSLDELSGKVNKSKTQVLATVLELEENEEVERKGQVVTLIDF